jgi:HlyD family secretion protein
MPDNTQPSAKQTLARMKTTHARKRFKRLVIGSGLLLIAAAFILAGNHRRAAGTMHYQIQPVQKGDLVITVTATGNLEATNQVEVGSELSGIITAMTADYNDTVKANQPLAYLDDAKYKAAAMKSRAEVASAKANYQEALATRNANQKTLTRYRQTRELTGGKLPSLEDLEQAEADLERSIAAVGATAATIDMASAALKENQTELEKTIIYSPINGIVLSRDAEPGQTVAASLEAPVLYTLAEDLRHMELQVDVDEADVGVVKEGQQATFSVDAYPDRFFAATITQVRFGAEETDGVVTYKAVLQVENPDLLLRPGMTATANIIVQRTENRLLVPNTALRFTPPKPKGTQPGKKSLLSQLMPGPPPRKAPKKQAGESGPPGPFVDAEKPAAVWVLKANQPMPVAVNPISTDGIMTAVASPDLHEGMPLVISVISPKG